MSVNLTIDEKKKIKVSWQGFMLATDPTNAMREVLYSVILKKNTKISLLASSNNINVSGFKSDEVYESMGYGRNANLIQGNTYVQGGKQDYDFFRGIMVVVFCALQWLASTIPMNWGKMQALIV